MRWLVVNSISDEVLGEYSVMDEASRVARLLAQKGNFVEVRGCPDSAPSIPQYEFSFVAKLDQPKRRSHVH